jgi:hypothetical protein
MQLDFAKISYSTVNIPELNIPMGLFFKARFTWFLMQADVAFALSSDGVDFAAHFNLTEFSRVGYYCSSVYIIPGICSNVSV